MSVCEVVQQGLGALACRYFSYCCFLRPLAAAAVLHQMTDWPSVLQPNDNGHTLDSGGKMQDSLNQQTMVCKAIKRPYLQLWLQCQASIALKQVPNAPRHQFMERWELGYGLFGLSTTYFQSSWSIKHFLSVAFFFSSARMCCLLQSLLYYNLSLGIKGRN